MKKLYFPLEASGGGGGGSVESDMNIDIYAHYDSSKEEWNTKEIDMSFGNNHTFSSILTMLQNTNAAPTISGGIKISADMNGMETDITFVPTEMFYMDMGTDCLLIVLNHFYLGTIMLTIMEESGEFGFGISIL